MARYLTQVSYTSEAMARLVNNPQDRGSFIRELIERLGGHVETFDFCFGAYHVATILEFPNDETMEAIPLAPRHEGLLVDPVYSGKALAGLIALVREGVIVPDQTVVFLHTGGTPALFGYRSLFG